MFSLMGETQRVLPIAALMGGSMMIYKVTDDSGFLGIINPDLYKSFVDENWEFEQLFAHFKMEIKKKNLLLWGTGGDLES